MKKETIKIFSFLISFSLGLFTTAPSFAEPPNLSILKNEIKDYHDSGRYEKELSCVISQAQNYILEQAEINKQEGNKKKLAIVLDIDETSLSNYNRMVKHDFSGDHAQIHRDIMAADAPVIAPMLSLYQNAQKQGVKIFFVTGRPKSEFSATKTNLLRAGFNHWAGLYLKPNNYSQRSIIPFKSKTREAITRQGYTIVASIGDQYSDLKGGYAKRGFKLPNPYYYLP